MLQGTNPPNADKGSAQPKFRAEKVTLVRIGHDFTTFEARPEPVNIMAFGLRGQQQVLLICAVLASVESYQFGYPLAAKYSG